MCSSISQEIRCLICYKSITGKHHLQNDDSSKDNNNQNIFILKELLEIPDTFYENWKKQESPSEWFKCCAACSEVVKQSHTVFQTLSRIRKQFESFQNKIHLALKHSKTDLPEKKSGRGRPKRKKPALNSMDSIREFVFNENPRQLNENALEELFENTETYCDSKIKVPAQVNNKKDTSKEENEDCFDCVSNPDDIAGEQKQGGSGEKGGSKSEKTDKSVRTHADEIENDKSSVPRVVAVSKRRPEREVTPGNLKKGKYVNSKDNCFGNDDQGDSKIEENIVPFKLSDEKSKEIENWKSNVKNDHFNVTKHGDDKVVLNTSLLGCKICQDALKHFEKYLAEQNSHTGDCDDSQQMDNDSFAIEPASPSTLDSCSQKDDSDDDSQIDKQKSQSSSTEESAVTPQMSQKEKDRLFVDWGTIIDIVRIQQIPRIPYGGTITYNYRQVPLWNTCSIDNQLQIMYALFTLDKPSKDYIKNFSFSSFQNISRLVRIFNQLDSRNFDTAKDITLKKLMQVDSKILETGNLDLNTATNSPRGTEEKILRTVRNLLRITLNRQCKNPNCSLPKQTDVYPIESFTLNNLKQAQIMYNVRQIQEKCTGGCETGAELWYEFPQNDIPPFVFFVFNANAFTENDIMSEIVLLGQKFTLFAYTVLLKSNKHFITVFDYGGTKQIYNGMQSNKLYPYAPQTAPHCISTVWMKRMQK